MAVDDEPVSAGGSRLNQRLRRQGVIEMLTAKGAVRIDDLARRFDVSVMTMHRDLDELEQLGLARKERGQATVLASSLLEANWAYRIRENAAAKELLARAALEFVDAGRAIILDDSTTGVYLAKHLSERAPVTVLTNFLAVVDELKREPGISVSVFGGQYHGWCDAMLGATTIDCIRNIRADLVFMSASAVSDGLCFFHKEETVLVKRAMFEVAAMRILYVDHSKFARRALHRMSALTDFDVVIVDSGVARDAVEQMQESGVNVVVADDQGRGDHRGRQRPKK